MRLAIFGVGSIGGWMAATLAQAGYEPRLIARGAALTALQTSGLRIERDGQVDCFRLPAAAATEFGPQDIVIVALKAQQLPAALADLGQLLGPDTCVVSAMNGVPWWFFTKFAGPLCDVSLDSVDPGGGVAQLIELRRVLGCVVLASVKAVAPGHFKVNGVDRLIFGEPDGGTSERGRWLSDAFARAGIVTSISPDVRYDIWTKLWGNMNMNPLSALTRASTGRLLDDPEVQQLCVRMMMEMAAAGERLGLRFPLSAGERMAMTRKLGDFRPSMLQDIDAGRALEYQAQLGAVVEIARRLSLPAPFCETVLGLTRLLSQSAVGR